MLPAIPIVPIVLAAGDSTRMGYPKALLPYQSGIFITHILDIIRKVGMPPPVIILGKTAPVVLPQIRNRHAEIHINPDPDRGQLSSIQLALSHIPPEFIAGMIWPVDQPAVSEDLVRGLVDLFLRSDLRIAYPMYGERRGHPAIFHRILFQEFMDAPMEEGPRSIILRHQKATVLMPTQESASVQDIDTPEEYEALTGEGLHAALSRIKFPKA
jgi:molybdenum cofactor cytidylyltransferase